MDSLSSIHAADARFYRDEHEVIDTGNEMRPAAADRDTTRGDMNIRGLTDRERTAAADSSLGFWHRPLEFGGSIVEVISLSPDGFWFDNLLLRLQARVSDLGREFVTDENPINQVLAILFGVCAFLFLVLEVMALYFGIRITTGITSAVAWLHKGTKRLATGDLNARIEIPNEDEFGDLAASFNETTAAVKRGQEQALARVRLERELQTAREIQERLLPDDVPASPGFEVTGISVPSRQVGGDYFDFLAQDDGKLGVAIGDVSGKGIPAALLMSNLQASLQGQVIHPSTVAEVVGRVNDLLVRSTDLHMFATFFYGVLDFNLGTFTYTNAGHNPPILCRADGSTELLTTGGLILGMMPEMVYGQDSVTLDPGDAVVLYTDGITEAVGPRGEGGGGLIGDGSGARPDAATPRAATASVVVDDEELEVELAEDPDDMFGEEALLEVIQGHVADSALELKERVLAAVARHTGDTPQSDDITLVVIKRKAG